MLTDTITGQIAMVAIPRRAENIMGVVSGVVATMVMMELATRVISTAPVTNVSRQVAGSE